MKSCPNCSKKCADTSKICVYCGNAFPEVSDAPVKLQTAEDKVDNISLRNDSSSMESETSIDTVSGTEFKPEDASLNFENVEANAESVNNDDTSPSSDGLPVCNKVYSFAESLPDGFEMSREEADELLFGNSSDEGVKAFGNARPTMEDREIVRNNASGMLPWLSGIFGLVFVMLSLVTMFCSLLLSVDGEVYVDISPEIRVIFYAIPFFALFTVLLIPKMVLSIGKVLCRNVEKKDDSALLKGLKVQRFAYILRCVLVFLLLASTVSSLAYDVIMLGIQDLGYILSMCNEYFVYGLILVVFAVVDIINAVRTSRFIRVLAKGDALKAPSATAVIMCLAKFVLIVCFVVLVAVFVNFYGALGNTLGLILYWLSVACALVTYVMELVSYFKLRFDYKERILVTKAIEDAGFESVKYR